MSAPNVISGVWVSGRDTASTEDMRGYTTPRTDGIARLAWAVIELAIHDLRDDRVDLANRAQAARWVLGRCGQDEDFPLTFQACCELIGGEWEACRGRLVRDYALGRMADTRIRRSRTDGWMVER